MYGDYTGFSPDYEALCSQEVEGDNQVYYDYNNESNMMMNQQPRINRVVPQYKSQSYMGYQRNQAYGNSLPSSFNQNLSMYPPQSRNIQNSSVYHQPISQYMIHRVPQPSINPYQQPPPQHSGQFVSIQTHEMLVKQYKMTLNMIKNQNNALIEKLKTQINKMKEQYKLVKSMLLFSDENEMSFIETEKFIDKFNSLDGERPLENIHEQFEEVDGQFGNSQNHLQKKEINSNLTQDETQTVYTSKNIISARLSPQAAILEKKIRNFNQKKANQKIKLQDVEKPIKQLPVKTIAFQTSESSRSQRQHLDEDPQDNLDPDQPMYPDDFEGQQSFLVDESVQAIQRQKKLQNHPKANTFGIQNPSINDFSFNLIDHQKNQNLKKECLIIKEFFEQFLWNNLEYAPKEYFMLYKIGKAELYNIYLCWKKNKRHPNLLVEKKLIQGKITTKIHNIFTSCKDHRDHIFGLKFKDTKIFGKTQNQFHSISV